MTPETPKRMASVAMSNIIRLSIFLVALISYCNSNQTKIKTPDNRFPLESWTISLECQANETADISLVTWSKTFLGSTKLIYKYDGKEGKIISNATWNYIVNESDEQDKKFTLEIRNITVSDVGTYECTMESNGVNYTEQTNVSVYGSLGISQVPDMALNGSAYTFRCSAEVAPSSPAPELISFVEPNIIAWYTKSSPVYLQPTRSEWIGLEPFGEALPVYFEEYLVLQQADYFDPHLIVCQFGIPETIKIENQQTNIGVPAENVRFVPTKSSFEIGETITCNAFGYPKLTYQWVNDKNSSIPTIEGQVLMLKDSNLGENKWTCKVENYINGHPYTDSANISFTVSSSGNTLSGSQPISVLFIFSILHFGM